MSFILRYKSQILLIICIILLIGFFMYPNSSYKQKEKTGSKPKQMNQPTPSATPSATLAPVASESAQADKYLLHKNIKATLFWVGEKATDENDYIPNESSAWDVHWLAHFGGIDTPYARNGYYPKEFKPKENPFYIALPYNDFDDIGRKQNAQMLPWYTPDAPDSYSFVKNRWVKLLYNGKVCYAQWEDVGPFHQDDFAYVFQGEKPIEKRAGIDISPAVRTCLKMATNDFLDWQFVDEENVPDGPWKEIITTTQVDW